MAEATKSTSATPASKPAPVRGPAPYELSDLILLPTAIPEIVKKTWTNNMEEWAKGVSQDKYHAREQHLAATAFSSEQRLITWILVPRPDADVTPAYASGAGVGGAKVGGGFDPTDVSNENLERILGALETYERPGLVARVGDEGVEDVSTMSVASVYVPSKYRHNGYGKLMMKLLWEEMESRKIAFSFLYSDLGPNFYSDFGWTARESTQILIPATYTLPAPPTARTRGSVRPITLDSIATVEQLQELVDQDALLVRQDLEHRLAVANANTNANANNEPQEIESFVAVTPEIRAIQWLHARAWFNASNIFSKNYTQAAIESDLKYGVRIPGTRNQFVLWHHDFTDDNLFILRWRLDPSSASSTEEDLDAITLAFAQAARDEAKKWKLSKIVFWGGDAALASLLGLKVQVRKDSIPSLGLLNTAYPGHTPARLEWVLNQKYSWC
ncbi:hypothetical protein BGW39_000598 [Mortierella sp. 14UC]|nr:hypothetical protein BGW39_000598 [Mortierella sp. 14UC]